MQRSGPLAKWKFCVACVSLCAGMLCGVIQILCLRLGDQVKPVAGSLWNTLKQVRCVH